jgi:hypothetical protein
MLTDDPDPLSSAVLCPCGKESTLGRGLRDVWSSREGTALTLLGCETRKESMSTSGWEFLSLASAAKSEMSGHAF